MKYLAIDFVTLSPEDEDLRGRVISIMVTRASKYLRISRIHPHGVNLLHQAIFQRICTGYQPSTTMMVDHIDGNPYNNTRENLRLVDRTTNTRNSSARRTNQAGLKGVITSKQRGGVRYYARLYLGGTTRVNGRMHATPREAYLDWLCMHQELQGYVWERATPLDIKLSLGRDYQKQGQTRGRSL